MENKNTTNNKDQTEYENEIPQTHQNYLSKRGIIFTLIGLFLTILLAVHFFSTFIHEIEMSPDGKRVILPSRQNSNETNRPTTFPIATKNQSSFPPTPDQKVLANSYHIFQSFNNCGPAALSMALSYFDISATQAELGQALRPYQNPNGDNDDKSVTLEEIATYANEKYGLTAYRRPMGDMATIKQFIANDIPVITRTWLKQDDDIGHFRIIKGYNDTRGIIIQDDSYQGKNLEYTYDDFMSIWKKFNYEYLVLVPKNKESVAKLILNENIDEKIAWRRAITNSEKDLKINPNDFYAGFNLSVAYYEIGYYQKSVEEYEKIKEILPFRTLWYQIEPLKALYEIKRYDELLDITGRILSNQNRAYSELYIIRGDIYKAQNNTTLARAEYEKAVQYNSHLTLAQNKLDSL
ncbi:MAG: C39 family peptidase [Candidatus Levybacteria bacterium]|nr:C39 family peptidase [Candidatus Levybacteria bacterium]